MQMKNENQYYDIPPNTTIFSIINNEEVKNKYFTLRKENKHKHYVCAIKTFFKPLKLYKYFNKLCINIDVVDVEYALKEKLLFFCFENIASCDNLQKAINNIKIHNNNIVNNRQDILYTSDIISKKCINRLSETEKYQYSYNKEKINNYLYDKYLEELLNKIYLDSNVLENTEEFIQYNINFIKNFNYDSLIIRKFIEHVADTNPRKKKVLKHLNPQLKFKNLEEFGRLNFKDNININDLVSTYGFSNIFNHFIMNTFYSHDAHYYNNIGYMQKHNDILFMNAIECITNKEKYLKMPEIISFILDVQQNNDQEFKQLIKYTNQISNTGINSYSMSVNISNDKDILSIFPNFFLYTNNQSANYVSILSQLKNIINKLKSNCKDIIENFNNYEISIKRNNFNAFLSRNNLEIEKIIPETNDYEAQNGILKCTEIKKDRNRALFKLTPPITIRKYILDLRKMINNNNDKSIVTNINQKQTTAEYFNIQNIKELLNNHFPNINIIKENNISIKQISDGNNRGDLILKALIEMITPLYEIKEKDIDIYFKKNFKDKTLVKSTKTKPYNYYNSEQKYEVMDNFYIMLNLTEDQNISWLLTMIYIFKHLKGNTILDPNYTNNAISIEQIINSIHNERILMSQWTFMEL